MVKGKGIVVSDAESEEEDPILLVILSEEGSILYSEKFESEFDAEIGENVPSEIMEWVKEEARIGIVERTRYEENTYLVKKYDKLIFCYVFLGKSFEEMGKLEEFPKLFSVQQISGMD